MTKLTKEINSKELCDTIIEGMQNKKAEDIVIIDLRKIENAVTDFFIISTANSTTQADSIAKEIVENTLAKLKEKPWHREGQNNAQWILLDYVNVVAHIFLKETRDYYELENLWADGIKRQLENY